MPRLKIAKRVRKQKINNTSVSTTLLKATDSNYRSQGRFHETRTTLNASPRPRNLQLGKKHFMNINVNNSDSDSNEMEEFREKNLAEITKKNNEEIKYASVRIQIGSGVRWKRLQ